MNDDLGKRMKDQYETRTRTFLPRRTYTIIRLDGKAFHTFTRGMKRPFDKEFAEVMDETTIYLCNEIQGCKFGFTQSDEISLLLTDFDKIETAAWFDGQVQKMVSVAASLATAKFNNLMLQLEEGMDGYAVGMEGNMIHESAIKEQSLAFFDARVFTIPDPIEVENYFVWRQKDAMRNAISMHAQSLFSTNQLHKKSQVDMRQMLLNKGEDHEDMPIGFRLGRSFAKPENIWDDAMKFPAEYPNGFQKIHYNFATERDLLSHNIPNYE